MGMYSTIEVNLTLVEPLDPSVICSIRKGDTRDYKEEALTSLRFRSTFKNSLPDLVELVRHLERSIFYQELTLVGSLSSEELSISDSRLYAYQNCIFSFKRSSQDAMYGEIICYHFHNLREKMWTSCINDYEEVEKKEMIFLQYIEHISSQATFKTYRNR